MKPGKLQYIVKHLLHVWLTVMSLWTQSSSHLNTFRVIKVLFPVGHKHAITYLQVGWAAHVTMVM